MSTTWKLLVELVRNLRPSTLYEVARGVSSSLRFGSTSAPYNFHREQRIHESVLLLRAAKQFIVV